MKNGWRPTTVFIGIFLLIWLRANAAVDVLTYHYNNTRTGANLQEQILTPANVNANTFGKLFSYPVDGYVYAQPLYVSGVTIPGVGTRNVLFVATEHNSVYAFDADSNAGPTGGLLWQVNLGPSAVTPTTDFGWRYGGYGAIVPEVGITGTPVIDRASGTLYVDAFTHEGNNYVHRVHALNITNGADKVFPGIVSASVPGTGVGGNGSVLPFDGRQHLQRAALTLAGGVLYVTYGGYDDTDPYHGWVIGLNPQTLATIPNYVFNTTPNATVAQFGQFAGEGGIWAALAVDAGNNLYFASGNGSFNAFNGSGGTEYGTSLIKLSTANSRLSVADYFTPYNQQSLSDNDIDFGSGGVLVLPDQPGPYPRLLVIGGKEGRLFLVNRDQFTFGNNHYNNGGNSDAVVHSFNLGEGLYCTPAWFNGRIYFAAAGDQVISVPVANGTFVTAQHQTGVRTFQYPGATPTISANGTQNGIVWALKNGSPAMLVAYDALNLNNEIYNSAQVPARDGLVNGVKFSRPIVANGKVYTGSRSSVAVFGLLGGTPPPPPPPPTNSVKTIWVEDNLPAGAISGADGGDAWTWVSSNPTPFSGALASQANIAAGSHQHFFYGATATLTVNNNDTLFAYVYLDPANVPAEIMLQWNDGSWEHRAYWGANLISYGTAGTASRQFMGPLPPAGQWVKLSVPASQVALGGRTLNGMAFSLYGGRATWDHAGKESPTNAPPPTDTTPPSVSITAPANNAVVSGTVVISANASDNVAVSNVQFRVDGANLGAPDASVPYSITWNTTTFSSGTHQLTAVARDSAGNQATSSVVSVTVSNGPSTVVRTVWVEDAVPAGATTSADNGDWWVWVNSDPTPFSGSLAHKAVLAPGSHQHFFIGATATLTVNSGDTLFAYVYLDPANVPAEIMLQWNDGSWEHRAFWGANLIPYGTTGTASRRLMGPLPPAGQWVKLSVPASQVSLENRTLNGMSFSLYNGRATWDYAGKESLSFTNPPPSGDTNPPSVSLTAPANNSTVSGTVTVSANASDNVAVSNVQFRVDGANLGAPDATAPYSISWNTTTITNGPHQLTALARDTSGNQTISSPINVTVSNLPPTGGSTIVWVEDDVPPGAVASGDGIDTWNWVSSNPAPFSGARAHQSAIYAGSHQHKFAWASTVLPVAAGGTLFAYVYLDPANPPQEIMLQWNDGSWEHRAYWGANLLNYGTSGTSRQFMGPLPPTGQWVRLSVPASQVALEGRTVHGMAFTLYGGRATWDYTGVSQ